MLIPHPQRGREERREKRGRGEREERGDIDGEKKERRGERITEQS